MNGKIKKHTALLVICLLLVSLLAAGCSGLNKTDVGNEINIALPISPTTIDSQLVSNNIAIYNALFFNSTLYKYNEKQELVPGLAESYEVSEDGLTVTFHLRKDALWSNGEPITAEDFVFAFQRLADPEIGSGAAYLITDSCLIKNAEEVNAGKLPVGELGVSAPDHNTFVVTLEMPCPYLISLFCNVCFSPCNRSFCRMMGADYASGADKVLSSGPYILDSYQPLAKQIHFHKNPYYYNADQIYNSGINIQVISNQQQGVMCYETGTLDITTIGGEMIDLSLDDPNYKNTPTAVISYLDFGYDNPALQNINIRMAISKSLDRQSIVNNVIKTGMPMERIIRPGFYYETDGSDFAKDPDLYSEYCEYDPKAAKEYWDKGLKELGLSELDLNFTYNSNNGSIAEAISSEIEKNLPGISLTLQPLPSKELFECPGKGGYDIILFSWGADYADPTAFMLLYVSGYGKETYSNPDFDALFMQSQSSEMVNNPDNRNQILHQMEEMLMEDAAFVPVWSVTQGYLVSDKISGFNTDPLGSAPLVEELKKEAE